MVADISPEVLFIVHTGDSAVTTVTMERYFRPTQLSMRSCFDRVVSGNETHTHTAITSSLSDTSSTVFSCAMFRLHCLPLNCCSPSYQSKSACLMAGGEIV